MMKKFQTSKEKRVNRKTEVRTFTKTWVARIITIALIDVQLTYVLAFFNKEIAETLSITIVSEIVGVMGVYMIKSYLETKEEKRMEYENRILDEDNTGE